MSALVEVTKQQLRLRRKPVRRAVRCVAERLREDMATRLKVQYLCCGEDVGADYLSSASTEEAQRRVDTFVRRVIGHERQAFVIPVDEYGAPLGDDRQ